MQFLDLQTAYAQPDPQQWVELVQEKEQEKCKGSMNRAIQSEIAHAVDAEISAIERLIGHNVGLGGSYATGDYIYPYSDIDLYVFTNADKRPMIQLLRVFTGVNPHISVIFRGGSFFYLYTFTYVRNGINYQIVFLPEEEKEHHERVDAKVKYSFLLDKEKDTYRQMKREIYERMENTTSEREKAEWVARLTDYKRSLFDQFKSPEYINTQKVKLGFYDENSTCVKPGTQSWWESVKSYF